MKKSLETLDEPDFFDGVGYTLDYGYSSGDGYGNGLGGNSNGGGDFCGDIYVFGYTNWSYPFYLILFKW